MGERERILIVGGGIGGLACAGNLARLGHDVEIAERQSDWVIDASGGITLQPAAGRAMRDLGCLDAALEKGAGMTRFEQVDAEGNVRHAVDLPRLCGPDYPATTGIARTDLHDILLAYATGHGARLRMGAEIAGIRDDPDGAVAEFHDAGEQTYDAVIGCDGINSTLRKLLGHGDTPEYTGLVTWRTTLERAPEVSAMRICATPDRTIGFVPISDEEMYVFCIELVEDFKRLAPEQLPARMRELLSPLRGVQASWREKITAPEQVVRLPIRWIFVSRPWNCGRVVLMGDAVHAPPPTLANGAAMALEDAVVMGDCLTSDGTMAERLARFSAHRQERCRLVVEMSVQRGEYVKGDLPEGVSPIDLETKLSKLLASAYRLPA